MSADRPRILLAGLFHETNTFVETPTRMEDFAILNGEEIFHGCGDASPMAGFLAAAREYDWEVVPLLDLRAMPGGMVADVVLELFWSTFVADAGDLANADAIFLVLHGAMVCQSFPDAEGELLARIRRLPGGADIPIFGVLDLHANFSAQMAAHANGLVAYRENPHTDARHSAQRAAAFLRLSLGTSTPQTHWRHSRMLLSPLQTGTSGEPMAALEALACRMETERGHRLSVNVWAGFAHADTLDTGLSFSVSTAGSKQEAEQILDSLVAEACSRRPAGTSKEFTVAEVMDRLDESPKPVLLVETADNIGGGAPGDGTTLLRALLAHEIVDAGIILNDPQAVSILSLRRVGDSVALELGGKGSSLDAGPIRIEVILVGLTDGRFELEDPKSHLASMGGERIDMGPTALVQCQGVRILITSRKTPPFDLGQWRSQGIDPATLQVIVVKAAVAHRQAYDRLGGVTFHVSTDGPCSENLGSLPYRRLLRPIYPLDLETPTS